MALAVKSLALALEAKSLALALEVKALALTPLALALALEFVALTPSLVHIDAINILEYHRIGYRYNRMYPAGLKSPCILSENDITCLTSYKTSSRCVCFLAVSAVFWLISD